MDRFMAAASMALAVAVLAGLFTSISGGFSLGVRVFVITLLVVFCVSAILNMG